MIKFMVGVVSYFILFFFEGYKQNEEVSVT